MSIKTILFVFLSASLFLYVPSVLKAEEQIKLKEVRIQGNLRVEEDGIRLHIKARQDDPFDPTVVSRDV